MLILVTGARGAIGRHLVRIAKAQGHRVVGLGHGAWTAEPGLPRLDGWINGGVDFDNLSTLLQFGSPDAIVHLAGGSLVGASVSNPGEDFRRTVESTQHLLEWHRRSAHGAAIIFVSSAAVYGDGHAGSISEDATVAPTSPYGTHKAMAELAMQAYASQSGAKVCLVRPFSVYGPGLRKQLIWDLAARLSTGEKAITLGGTGEERRDFVHIEEAAGAMLQAIALAGPGAPIFNLCTGAGTTVADLAAMTLANFDGATIAFSGERRSGDPRSLVGNPAKSHRAGLRPTRTLEDGLAETIAWIRRDGRNLAAGS